MVRLAHPASYPARMWHRQKGKARMSYFKQHVFICTNQRTDGRASCEDHGASELRAYLKMAPRGYASIMPVASTAVPWGR